ncbi:hypothetical protein CHO01_17030 [Cellulomonas hominis]|uniref:Uncharacterized protein n=1 Tax=Cellulomonas hominis TaxID=156981 RepID=A0A511FE35_9CELL|nr:hypothetical protein [Cellulomonas hominis]MBB5474549.1 hypothetical protein [Cellulomonas hominis]NKY05613.1 hypothetical protein [Cellulomonas hominis]GEL46587.1 hypothetical protein CHO01_17030 [Cellulomonas hominis]
MSTSHMPDGPGYRLPPARPNRRKLEQEEIRRGDRALRATTWGSAFVGAILGLLLGPGGLDGAIASPLFAVAALGVCRGADVSTTPAAVRSGAVIGGLMGAAAGLMAGALFIGQ